MIVNSLECVSHNIRVDVKRVTYDDSGFDKLQVSSLRPLRLADRPRLHGKPWLLNLKLYSLLLASQPRKHLITSIYQIIVGLVVLIGCDDTNDTACPQTP